ncbi:MAG: LuxR C-terminal-related transcriptional regulator, partial [Bacteroidota bacterium]
SLMKKTIFLYAGLMSMLVLLMKFMDYRLFVHDISTEIYIGIIATLCTGLGVWMGLKLTRPKVIVKPTQLEAFELDPKKLTALGMSRREYDVLELMAQGMSNQEIADKLFISLNTVKTHSSNLFMKLDVKRRTQAVQYAKQIGILP